MASGEREALLGESPAPDAGVGDTKWSPHAVAVKAGDGWRAWAVPAGSSAALVLFVVAQSSAMWIAEGGADVSLPGHHPSNSHASVSYNLPDTVLELFRSNEHLLGTRVLRSHTPVACNRQMKSPFLQMGRTEHPPLTADRLCQSPPVRVHRRARAGILGSMAASQARVRARRVVHARVRAKSSEMAPMVSFFLFPYGQLD